MFKQILYVSRPKEWADTVTAFVRDLAIEHQANVIVLRVTETPEDQIQLAKKIDIDPQSKASQLETAEKVASYKVAETIVKELVDNGVTAWAEARVGRIVDEIVDASLEFDADIIVMGGSKRSALTAFLTGSVPSELVRKSLKPVLFVPLST